MPMIPPPGTTCAFDFIAKFALLNGVYKVTSEVAFVDAVASGVDFVTNLYTPAGLSASDYSADYAGYVGDIVLILQSVSDEKVVVYAPTSTFRTIPDSTIKAYDRIVMVVDIGPQADTQVILPLRTAIQDYVRTQLGITDPVSVLTDPTKRTYLTQAQYDTLEQAREANKQALSPVSVQLQAALAQNAILAAKVAYYETLLVQTATT